MLVVREKNLPSFIPVSFESSAENPAVRQTGRKPALHAVPVTLDEREVFVPREPVRLPAARQLSDCEALAQARAGVSAALDELCRAEAALESQLADMQAFLEGRAGKSVSREIGAIVAQAA